VAVACEDPQESAREISHWTPRELAAEVQKREIVETLSPRHLGRILAEMDLQPHRSRYWLNNERDQDPTAFDADVQAICDLYALAPTLAHHGTHLESLDERPAFRRWNVSIRRARCNRVRSNYANSSMSAMAPWP
jgi:hypothetical protein